MGGLSQVATLFLTGASGFIGSRLLFDLVERGHRVVATDVAAPRRALPAGARFYAADVRDIERHAAEIGADCDAIVHCGGISGPMLLGDDPAEVLDINIRGTVQLLDLARRRTIRRFVGLSSVSAYGSTPGRDVVDEEAPLTATNAYGTSKAAGDLVLQTFAAEHGLSAVALRIGWVYGPGRATDALIQPIVRSAAGAAYHLPSGRDHLLQFVHVDDVVAAIRCALDAERPPRSAYNVNGGERVSVGDIAAMIAEVLPAAKVEIGPGLLAGTEVQGRMVLDAAARDLGWRPEVDLRSGLESYVRWLQHNPY